MNFKCLLISAIFSVMFFSMTAEAQEAPLVDYKDQPVIDSDLDGLTDQGELDIYHTDSNKTDSDNDGFSDGTEILSETNPLDASSFPGTANISAPAVPAEAAWAWYTTRSAGLIAFLLLYISAFLGLGGRIPGIRKISQYFGSIGAHCWISVQVLIFAALHGLSPLFDKFFTQTYSINLKSIFLPLSSNYHPVLMGLGTVGLYIMIVLVISSYTRRWIPRFLWRSLHYFNLALFVFIFFHALRLGTDMKNPVISGIFIIMNASLGILIVINIISKIFIHSKPSVSAPSYAPANLHQTAPTGFPKEH